MSEFDLSLGSNWSYRLRRATFTGARVLGLIRVFSSVVAAADVRCWSRAIACR